MELARMNQTNKNETNNEIIRRRVDDMKIRVLDGLDDLLDRMAPPPPDPAPALSVARRLVSNQFKLFLYCDHSRCRRSQCCRGEPRDCLLIGLPLLPLEAITEIVQPGARTAKRRRRRDAGPAQRKA
jgi:hypothetical protein